MKKNINLYLSSIKDKHLRIYHLTRMRQKNLILFIVRVFVLAFVIDIKYNRIIHKTQLQKLIFLFFLAFLISATHKTKPLKQTLHVQLI